MAWMKTLADFDYKPKPGVTVAYRAGKDYNAPRAAVTLAVAAGRAVRLRKTGKYGEPTEWQDDQPLGNSEIASA